MSTCSTLNFSRREINLGRPKLFLTNDDGIKAEGLAALCVELSTFADIYVVAPDGERSAAGAAVTLRRNLRATPTELSGAIKAWAIDGTPADCSKLATTTLLRDIAIDLAISGINNGPNVGVNIFYSGTVGAAIEAVINGTPSVALSKEFGTLLTWTEAAILATKIIKRVLNQKIPCWQLLNVNLPDRKFDDKIPVALTLQGTSGFKERYTEVEGDSEMVRTFELSGEMQICESNGATDAEALLRGEIAITPLRVNLNGEMDSETWRHLLRD